jgi:hypothetical protein
MLLPQKYLANKTVGLLSSDETDGLTDIIANGWWSNLGDRPANTNLVNGFSHSFSNVFGRSGLSSHGIKPVYNLISFSVGIEAPTDYSYVTKDCNETSPTASIKNGALTFSIPQTHYYFGVGDVVTLNNGSSDINVYINHKTTCLEWLVHDGSGNIPDDGESLEVVRFDKAFHSLSEAFGASGIENVLGTKDILSLRSSLRVLCYDMIDDVGDVDSAAGWSRNDDCAIKIYTPTSTKTDCNMSQRHHGNSSYGYTIQKSIRISYCVQVEGLIFKKTGSGDSAIIIAYDGVANCNIITGAWAAGVEVTGDCEAIEISNNYFNGNTLGIKIPTGITGYNYFHIYNNTFNDCTTAIAYDNQVPVIANCIMQGGTKCLDDGGSGLDNVSYCITSDATSDGASNSYHDTTLQLTNTATDDLSAKYVEFGMVGSGSSVVVVGETDIAGNFLDDTFCIGAYHETQVVIFSVGPTDGSMESGTSTATIVGGLLTFSEAQVDDNLCAGCIVSIVDTGLVVLRKKISDTEWEVVNTDGTPVVGDGSTKSVNSIRFSHDDIYSAVDSILLYDPIDDDVKIIINCSTGSSFKCAEINANTDKTRNILIQTPMENCNSTRRHNGKWDDNLFVHYGEEGGEKSLRILCPYVTVDGLQIRGGQYGVYCEEVGALIQNNIIRDCGANGITVDSNNGESNNSIVNNLIYDCFGSAIEFVENIGKPTIALFADLVVRFIENGDGNSEYEVCIDSNNTGVDYPTITWLPERLEILYDSTVYTSLSDIIENAKVYGEPWAILSYTGDEMSSDLDKKISLQASFIMGNYGYENNYLNIYNNTAYKCNDGVVVWSNPNNRFFNRCSLKNNIVKKCTKNAYINHCPKSPWVIADCCIGDDDTLNKFLGYSNLFLYSFDFDNGFYINLYESLRVNVINLRADTNFSFNYDSTGYDRSSILWSAGFVNYHPLRSGRVAHYSVGADGMYVDGSTLSATVSNGIMTIVGSIDPRVGIGDIVNLATQGNVTLAEKGTDNKWFVTDNTGVVFPNVGVAENITYMMRPISFSSAIDSANSSGTLGEMTGTADLVNAELSICLWFYKDDEFADQKIRINGWTTSADYNMRLIVPYNTNTQCVTRQRHSGYYGGVVFNDESADEIVKIENDYITVEGFVFNKDLADTANILVDDAYDNCLIKCNVVAGGDIGIDLGIGNIAMSNIVYNQHTSGIDLEGSESYNNTCINNGDYAFNSHDATDEIINCIGSGASVSNFNGTGQFINCSQQLSNGA